MVTNAVEYIAINITKEQLTDGHLVLVLLLLLLLLLLPPPLRLPLLLPLQLLMLHFVVSKASIPSFCLNTTNAVVCDVNENVFICSYVVCAYANYCHVVSMQGVPWSFSALKYR